MTFDEKVRLLRRYEQRVYAICLLLLAQERSALQASEEALADLFENPAFAGGTERERSRLAKSAAVRRCVKLKLESKPQEDERGYGYAHG